MRIQDFFYLVHHEVSRFRRRYRRVDRSDLFSAGAIGLMEACSRFDGTGSFEAYAKVRIRGSMLDELRRNDPLGRLTRTRRRIVMIAQERLTAMLGRPPLLEELSKETGLSLRLLQRTPLLTDAYKEAVMDDEIATHLIGDGDCEQQLMHAQILASLHHCIQNLPERKKAFLNAYVKNERRLADVGRLFGVKESRASQMLSEIKAELRLQLKEVLM